MSAQRYLFFLYQCTISHKFSLLFEYFASFFRVALFKIHWVVQKYHQHGRRSSLYLRISPHLRPASCKIFSRLGQVQWAFPGVNYELLESLVRVHKLTKAMYADIHEKYGDIVRVGPNELSFADPKAIREIYGPGGSSQKV
jgi:hypothetical protein